MSHLTNKGYILSFENKFYSKSEDTDGACIIKNTWNCAELS